MTLRELLEQQSEDAEHLAQLQHAIADARDSAQEISDPATQAQKNAQISRGIHTIQMSQLALITRQLLWIQQAMLAKIDEE